MSSLDDALRGVERVLLDTPTLLAFHGQHEAAQDVAKHLLGRIEDAGDPLQGYYSVVSATELLVRPLRSGPLETAYMQWGWDRALTHFRTDTNGSGQRRR